MNRKVMAAVAAGAAVAVGGTGVALAIGRGGGGDSRPAGPQAQRAIAAALRITGGVKANSVELDNENGATYEVEVAKADGSTVDVRLDAAYEVVATEPDSEQNDGPDNEQNGDGAESE